MTRSRLGFLTRSILVALAAVAVSRPGKAAEPPAKSATLPATSPASASTAATAPASASPATGPAAADPARLRAAVLRLGSTSAGVREQATRELWAIGRPAEAVLRAAAAGDDPEVSARARAILQDFQLGITPDTPAFVLDAIRQYRQGDALQRRRALTQLGESAGADGRGPLLRLYAQEKDASWRREILSRLHGDGVASLARIALLGGEEALAAQLLADAAEGSSAGAADFAAYALARGRVDQEIARLKAAPPGPGEPLPTARRGVVLAYFYRAKGDLPAARKIAETCDPASAAYLALYAGDSAPLETLSLAARPTNGADAVAVPLAFRWLAGDQPNVRQAADIAREWVDAHPDDAYPVAKALLLADQRDAALEVSRRRGQYRTAFEVLEAQQRFADALKVAAEAAREPTKPGPAAPPERLDEALYVRAQGVRLLAKLGEPDKARDAADALAQAADALRSAVREQRAAAAAPGGQGARPVGRANPAPKAIPSAYVWQALAAAERGLGRPEQAVRHVLAAIEAEAGPSPRVVRASDMSGTPLEALFPKRGEEAAVWWRFFRANFPIGDDAGRVERVREVMDGKADAGRVVEWARSIRTATTLPPGAAAADDFAAGRGLASLAETLYAYQQPAEAEACVEAAGRIDRRTDPFARAGEAALARGDADRAAEWFARSAQRQPAAASVYLRGVALRRAGHAVEADEAIALAKVLPLGDEWERLRLAEAMEKHAGDGAGEGPADAAAAEAAKAAAREQEDIALRTCPLGDYEGSNSRRHWANRQATAGNFIDAAQALRFSLLPVFRANANFSSMESFVQIPAVAHTWRARGLLKAGDIAAASADAEAAVDAMPNNVEIAIELVNALDEAKARPRADALFRRAATACKSTCWSFPNYAQGHNAAAWLAARCDRELGQGLVLAQRAVELEPKNVAFIDTLAEVLFRLGRRDEAVEQMRKCIELEPRTEYFQKQLKRFTDPPATAPATRPVR